MSNRNRNKRRKFQLIVGILIVIIIVIIGYQIHQSNIGPRITSFNVIRPDLSRPNLVAEAFQLGKVEVWGISDATSTKVSDIDMGPMKLSEADKAGNQTWVLQSPTTQIGVKEVYAQGFDQTGGKKNRVSLPYKTPSQLVTYLWPSPTLAVLTGTVKDIGSKSLSMGVASPAPAAITVFFGDKMAVIDAKGITSSVSKIKSNSVIVVTGTYTNENTFLASEIQIGGQ